MFSGITDIRTLIQLANDIKNYLTPEYEEATKELIKLTDEFLDVNQKVFKIITRLELLDLQDKEKVAEFLLDFNSFKHGPDFDKCSILAHHVLRVSEKTLYPALQEIFVRDKEKLEMVKGIFWNVGFDEVEYDDYLSRLAFDIVELSEKIKDGISEDIRKKFFEQSEAKIKELEQMSNSLRTLRLDLLKLTT